MKIPKCWASMALALMLAGCAFLAACATAGVKNDVAALATGLAAAERLALEYVVLPDCDKPDAPAVCSKDSVVESIDKARKTAVIAVKQAQAAAFDPNLPEGAVEQAVFAAENALTAFRAAIPIITN